MKKREYYYDSKDKPLQEEVWEYYKGGVKKDCVVYHVNGCKADNDIDNLDIMNKRYYNRINKNEL